MSSKGRRVKESRGQYPRCKVQPCKRKAQLDGYCSLHAATRKPVGVSDHADTIRAGLARSYGRCPYCGGIAKDETCRSHADLPALDPNRRLLDKLARREARRANG